MVDQFAMLCRAILSFDAGITYPVMGTAALIAAMVGAAPGIIITIIALPLRHGLLGIKAHAALISGAPQHWGSSPGRPRDLQRR